MTNAYDRSAHPPTSVALQAWGIPPKAVKVLLIALQTMQFFLRTGFGESQQSYGGTREHPIFGFGQGNGAAPPGFAALSALLINAYKRMGNGAKLTSSYTARMFVLAAVMYVDDTDLTHLAPSQLTSDADLFKQVQKSTTNWVC